MQMEAEGGVQNVEEVVKDGEAAEGVHPGWECGLNNLGNWNLEYLGKLEKGKREKMIKKWMLRYCIVLYCIVRCVALCCFAFVTAFGYPGLRNLLLLLFWVFGGFVYDLKTCCRLPR